LLLKECLRRNTRFHVANAVAVAAVVAVEEEEEEEE
jgi:hypothetical protein